jgi:hypothetical protein
MYILFIPLLDIKMHFYLRNSSHILLILLFPNKRCPRKEVVLLCVKHKPLEQTWERLGSESHSKELCRFIQGAKHFGNLRSLEVLNLLSG